MKKLLITLFVITASSSVMGKKRIATHSPGYLESKDK